MGKIKVPMLSLGSIVGLEELELVAKAMQQYDLSGWRLEPGKIGAQLQEEFQKYIGVKHAIPTTSCTASLHLATMVLNLKEGDEVITSPQTFWATTRPLLARRVKTKFADIDPQTLNMDPSTIEPLITERTKAIFVVHYGGQPADMDPILSIARKHNLYIVEDAAHAIGTEYKGRKPGSFGDIGCFSFHTMKNLITGEGGMATTNSDEIAENILELRTIYIMGKKKKRRGKIGPYEEPPYYKDPHARDSYNVDFEEIYEVGVNYRLSEILSAVALAQLRKLDKHNRRRQEIGKRLDEGLSQIEGIRVQKCIPEATRNCHLYNFFLDQDLLGVPQNKRVKVKDEFIRILEQEESITIQLRYFPIHLLPEYRYMGHRFGECPVAEKVFFEQQINPPIYPQLTDNQVEHMIGAVKRTMDKIKKMGW